MTNIATLKLNKPEIYKQFIALSSFETNPEEAKKSLAINLSVTKQELDNLFSTKRYERPYQPEYFNPLEEIIGELYVSESIATAIKLVTDKINMFIPRIVINNNTNFEFQNHTVLMSLVFYDSYDYNRTLYTYERKFYVIE